MIRAATAFLLLLSLAPATASAQRIAFDPPTAREAAILNTLAEHVQFQFRETTLVDVCNTIRRNRGIRPMLEIKALDDIGIDTDTTVTLAIDGVPLRTALDAILSRIDPSLKWAIEREMLVISTQEAFDERLQTWIYDVTDLVRFDVDDQYYDSDYDSLIELVSRTVEPDSWDEVGGPGSIADYELQEKSLLVVSQSYATHQEIDALLRKMYRLAGRPVPVTTPVSQSYAKRLSQSTSLRRSTSYPTSAVPGIYNPRGLPMTKSERRTISSDRSQPKRRRYITPAPQQQPGGFF